MIHLPLLSRFPKFQIKTSRLLLVLIFRTWLMFLLQSRDLFTRLCNLATILLSERGLYLNMHVRSDPRWVKVCGWLIVLVGVVLRRAAAINCWLWLWMKMILSHRLSKSSQIGCIWSQLVVIGRNELYLATLAYIWPNAQWQPIVAKYNLLWRNTTHFSQITPILEKNNPCILAKYNPFSPNTTHLRQIQPTFAK